MDAGIPPDSAKLLALLPALARWRDRRDAAGKDPRPFIVEIAGMPKAGKSSTIAQVRHFFSHGLKALVGGDTSLRGTLPPEYRVYTPAEGVSQRTPAQLKDADNLLEYNTWAGAYALQELLWANHNDFYDLVILDRGPWDAGCWLEYVQKKRKNDSEVPECLKDIIAFFQLPEWTVKADLHIVLVVDPASAHEREKQERLIPHRGPASNKDLMEEMERIYRARFEALATEKAKHCDCETVETCLLIQTTNRDRLSVAREVIERILTVAAAGAVTVETAAAVEVTTASSTITVGSVREAEIAARGTGTSAEIVDGADTETTAELVSVGPVGTYASTRRVSLTVAEVRRMIWPFLKNMKPSQRRNIGPIIKEIVAKARVLSPEGQTAFLANLSSLIPDEQELLNSVSADVLGTQLHAILDKSRNK